MLTGLEIRKQVEAGRIEIEDFRELQLNPNSYNLRLDDELFVYKDFVLDMKKPNQGRFVKIPDGGLVLEPGVLYLGSTKERTFTEDYVPMLEGRSSVGRLGLFVHVTAGFGDVGFNGRWTLELSCVQPIRVYAGVDICQVFFHELTGEKTFYGLSGKYQNAVGVQPSYLFRDFEKGR